ncbi:hypothetical protein JDV02_007335 [Purpureocillium takamizusanense]|uniref:Zn(2)-C6 fungal-type domain-containing protein n=1 Tax=Purpureocillium takamizusanense TaxID=2060973 RepID=A0A9Q8VDM5_9HYPO|nr:uncharacterized protein JDV02_007335 [Purpureocillium takamizusanense]UNI21336.1 hypothetical protein JDV02_007335 [Purpureocillium takamizusanense]
MSSSNENRPAERLDDSADLPPRKRRRPATSCEACRTRKVRCDQGLPCGPCKRSRRKADCVYRSERNQDGLDARPSTSVGSEVDGQKTRARASTGFPMESEGEYSLAARVERLERLLDRQQSTHQHAPIEPNPAPPPRLLLRNTAEKTRLFGRGHWMYVAQALPTHGTFDNHGADFELRDDGAAVSDVMELFVKLRAMRTAVKARGTRFGTCTGDVRSDFLGTLPSWRVMESLVHCCYDFFVPLYEAVGEDDDAVWAYAFDMYKKCGRSWMAAAKEKWPDSFLMKLGLRMALGGTVTEKVFDGFDVHEASQYWIILAQSWLTGQREKDTMNLEGLEIFALLLLAKQATRHATGPTWISAGSLMSAAMSMGLHHDPAKLAGISPQDAETRKRLWAATLELTIQSHLDAATPVLISADDFDTPEPLPPRQARGEGDLQGKLCKSLPLRLRVARLVNGIKGPSYDEAILLAKELRNESRGVVAYAERLSMPSSANVLDDGLPGFVDILFHRYIMMLLQPWMIKSRTDSRYHLARRMCTESALAIASYASDSRGSSTLKRLARVGRGFWRGPFALPVVLVLCLEVFLLLEEDGPTSRGVVVGGRLEELRAASRTRVVAALETIKEGTRGFIRDGSVSLKSFNFLAAFLAQIRAIEEGRDAKRAVIEALSESLEECAQLVRETYPWLSGSMDEMVAANDSSQNEEGRLDLSPMPLVSFSLFFSPFFGARH